MASTSPLLLFLFFSFFHLSVSFLLPVSKHSPTNQYLTRIHLGSKPEPLPLLLDLSSPSLWLVDCPSHTPIPSLSIPCSTAGVRSQPLSTTTDTCALPSHNPVSKLSATGQLVSDSVLLSLNSPSQPQIGLIEGFLFVCAPQSLAHGLPGGARGVFGLGKSSRISPLSQFAHQFDLPGKFSLCLPGKTNGNGFIITGKSEMSKSLLYTPLIGPGPGSGSADEYYIGVKSIKINNKKITLPGPTIRAKLSTVDPLTKMGSGVYKTFVKAFAMAANLMRVGPFGLCYGAGESSGGVPVIDLVLQSEMVRWRINGRDLMVEAGEGVVCLGVVDGGVELGEDEMVIGANLLEDVLVEFDLRSGMLGFSGSLVEIGTSCDELGSDASGLSLDS